MKKYSEYSAVLTRCQEQRCNLTRGWENINHAIQPGCVCWEQPTSKEKSDSHSIDYISPFPASISNDWVPDVEIDDTPPLTSDSDDSDSDSDTEVEKSRNRLLKKFNIGQQSRTSFRCPVAGCPKASSKPWKNVASLHGHLADHCVGKFQGTVPLEYFDQWDKQFCSKCGKMRKSFAPSLFCSCCSRKPPASVTLLPNPPDPLSHPHISASSTSNSLQHPLSCPPNVSLPSLDQIVKVRVPTLKYVPKRIRSEWSRVWSETIQDCLYINDLPSFTYLFLLTKVCLRIPPSNIRSRKAREDFTLNLMKRWRGTALTNGNASKFLERITLWNELLLFVQSRPKTKFSQEEINKKRVLQMVADGRLSAACASLLSDALSEANEENLAKLLEKHPPQDIPTDALSSNGLEQLQVSPDTMF